MANIPKRNVTSFLIHMLWLSCIVKKIFYVQEHLTVIYHQKQWKFPWEISLKHILFHSEHCFTQEIVFNWKDKVHLNSAFSVASFLFHNKITCMLTKCKFPSDNFQFYVEIYLNRRLIFFEMKIKYILHANTITIV